MTKQWSFILPPCYPHTQRDFHAKARLKRDAAHASLQTLVSVARAMHLPAPPPARASHPHAT